METTPYDLVELDRYLMSGRSAEDSMGLSDMDGLLTCVAIGPELIPPSEWFPMILGEGPPDFESDGQTRVVFSAIMGRYNDILTCFETGPEAFEPIFRKPPDGTTIVTDWAAGFLVGMSLRRSRWKRMIEHRSAYIAIEPIMMLGDKGGVPHKGIDMAKFASDGPTIIPLCLVGIYDFWMAHPRVPRTPRKAKNKTRRH